MSLLLFVVVLVLCASVHTVKNVCTNNRHTTGIWKRHHHLNSTKSFYCCSILDDDPLNDNAICGKNKLDLQVQYGSLARFAQATGHACQCDAIEGRLSVSNRERYEWVPEFCYLLPWNATQFCDLLGNRTLMFVGDSTMQQTATTIMSMVTAGGGKCGPQLIAARSFLLFCFAENTLDMFYYVNNFKPDICIMGAGAHQGDLGDMYSVLENVKNKMPELKKWSPKTKYVWKTINPGHTYCKNYSEPLLVPELNQTAFNYALFPTYDKAGYEYANRLGWRVMDMSPLYLRPDAHSDCMHYCVPGPLDIAGSILLTMLYNGEV